MPTNKSLVTKRDQIIGGQRYIQVLGLNENLQIDTFVIIGQPYKSARQDAWFGKNQNHYAWGVYKGEFSFDDCNIPPNHYNHHTLWRFDMQTMSYLQKLKSEGLAGYCEYMAILESCGMAAGTTFHGYSNPDWDDDYYYDTFAVYG